MCKSTDKTNQPSNVPEKERYLNYEIIKCHSVFGTPYYTILNPATNVHVHARTRKIARRICDEADFFIKYGFFRTRQIDIMNRSGKLPLRTVRDRRKRHESEL